MGWKQKVLARIYRVDYQKIQQKIMKAEVVSFDIFDTLIRRNVINPTDIFELVGNEFERLTGKHIENYKKLRCGCERAAYEKSRGEEITWNQIFENMKEISNEDINLLKKIELEYEIEMSCPDKKNKKLYEFALKHNKRVILVSDMYLDKSVIEKILNKNGIDVYEKLYLSSVCGVRKNDGLLYKYLLKELQVSPSKILHIGDSFRGDIIQAKKNGLSVCLIPRYYNSLKYWKMSREIGNDVKIQYSMFYAFLNNHALDELCDNKEAVTIGHEVLGPMLLGYCKWLNDKIENDKIEKIFFLSRDGKMLQEAFNILYPQNEISQSYLYVSRQALCVPLLADAADFDEMIGMIKMCFHLPILKSIAIVCGLEQKKFNNELHYIDLDEQTKIHEIPKEKKGAVYSIVKRLGQFRFESQKEYVGKYLEQNGFGGNVAIVDIGWNGTIQMVLQKYKANSDTVIHGYYLGVRNMEVDDYYTNVYRSGYLFEPGRGDFFNLMQRFTMNIFELMFQNRTGSVQGYDIKDEKVIPIFNKSEYAKLEEEFIENIQFGALQLLNRIRENGIFRNEASIAPEVIMNAYSHFAVYPSLSTIKIFENYKSFDGYVRKILPEHDIFYYMLHLRQLRQDIEEMDKIFFLKKLFKIKFPYFQVLRFLVVRCGIKSEYRSQYFGKKG